MAILELASTNSSMTSLSNSSISTIGCGVCSRRKERYHGTYGVDCLVAITSQPDEDTPHTVHLQANNLRMGIPVQGRSRKGPTWWYGCEFVLISLQVVVRMLQVVDHAHLHQLRSTDTIPLHDLPTAYNFRLEQYTNTLLRPRNQPHAGPLAFLQRIRGSTRST